MKRISFIIATVALAIGMLSCGKSKQSLLVGTWGVERIEYYNIDYYGQPIESTIHCWEYTPGDIDNGIELVFKDNKKGEWRDHDVDTILVEVSVNPLSYDTIIAPDTTIYTSFTYIYDEDIPAIFVNTANAETYMLHVQLLDESTLIYTNEYELNYEERAVLKRLDGNRSSVSRSSVSRKSGTMPRKPGSFFYHGSLNVKR